LLIVKPKPISKQSQIEERSLDKKETWGILCHAARIEEEEVLGFGWVSIQDSELPILTVTFNQESATKWLQMPYTAYTALEDPISYMDQLGLSFVVENKMAPTSAIIGHVEGEGSILITADWALQSFAELTILAKEDIMVRIAFGSASIAHLIQVTTQAFLVLEWPVPE